MNESIITVLSLKQSPLFFFFCRLFKCFGIREGSEIRNICESIALIESHWLREGAWRLYQTSSFRVTCGARTYVFVNPCDLTRSLTHKRMLSRVCTRAFVCARHRARLFRGVPRDHSIAFRTYVSIGLKWSPQLSCPRVCTRTYNRADSRGSQFQFANLTANRLPGARRSKCDVR